MLGPAVLDLNAADILAIQDLEELRRAALLLVRHRDEAYAAVKRRNEAIAALNHRIKAMSEEESDAS